MTKTDRRARQKFSIGYHLNSWDLAGLPLEPALQFLAEQGFGWFEILSGTSLSDLFCRKYMTLGDMAPPRPVSDTDILRRFALLSEAQRNHGIRLSSLYMNCELTNPRSWPQELEILDTIARVLAGFGAPMLVIGGGAPETSERPHGAADYDAFCTALEEIGRRTQDLGIWTVYHPHLDTFVENRAQLDRMMERLDTSVVGLCIDPAHLAQADSDPVDALRTYMSAVRYMHFKDTRVDPAFKGFDRYKAFCELGAGVVEMEALVDVLIDADYDGIAVIELDVSAMTAEASALQSIAYVRDALGLDLTPTLPSREAIQG